MYETTMNNPLKRKLEVTRSVSDAKDGNGAAIHGIVTELSPVKKSKKDEKRYFDGMISDDRSCSWLVSFEPSLREKLNEAMVNNDTISLLDCRIKEGEIFLNKFSKVQSSPVKIDIASVIRKMETQLTSLSEVPTLHDK